MISLITTLAFSSIATALHLPHVSEVVFQVPEVVKVATDPIPWACDIRSWVRAPDLSPGISHPAETRLAANGSACGDIIKWQVGLRFKERAIVKISSKDVEQLPVKPVWNMTFSTNDDFDPGDIYQVGWSRNMNNHDEEMNQYNLALQNRSLWEVHGAERQVFDQVLDLALEDTEVVGDIDIDIVQSFAVHMPNTNFPPIEANPHDGEHRGGQEQMIRTETMLEYYHLLHLRNGTVIDVPAGRAAFLPAPKPVTLVPLVGDVEDRKVELVSPRLKPFNNDLGIVFAGAPTRDTRAPTCDDGNLTRFTVKVDPPSQPPVQGQNVTLNLTITKTGNGSEIPIYIEVGHSTTRNITYAWNYLSSADEYEAIINPKNGPTFFRSDSQADKMLMIESDEALEKERKRFANTTGGQYVSWSSMGGRGFVRHDFVNKSAEVHQFQVDVPIGYNDFPTFEATFQTFRSSLKFQIYTTYTCLNLTCDDPSAGKQPHEIRDDEWTEYHPPHPSPPCRKDRPYYPQPHKGTVFLDALPSTSDNPLATHHYLQPGALGPSLSSQLDDKVEFTLLSQEKRPESENELRKTRYGYTDREKLRWTQRKNNGGGWMHAAKLWQGEVKRQNPFLEDEDAGSSHDVVAESLPLVSDFGEIMIRID